MYSCKCLNVRIRPQLTPVGATIPPTDGDYSSVYVGDSGIITVRPDPEPWWDPS